MTGDDATIASLLEASLPTTRWFADKSASIAGVTIHDRLPLPQACSADVILADVALAGHAVPSRYVAVIGDAGVDAAATPACGRWLLDIVLSGGERSGRSGRLIGHRVVQASGSTSVAPVGPITVGVVGGDASNTSLVVRSATAAWVVKLLRRCREGICPEVEIGEFFAAESPWCDTPRLCGWLEYVPVNDPSGHCSVAIATVHEFIPGHTTGWERLVNLLIAGDGMKGRSGQDVFALVTALGRVTARMHRALAARPDIPAFAATAATPTGLGSAGRRMRMHAERVFASIHSRLRRLPPALAQRLGAVLNARTRLASRFECLPDLAPAVSTIRVHGDYHLGQVLVAEHDHQPLVIDFEGEPGRTLEERREKTLAAKDVAGMCRSFDYLLRHVAKSTGSPYAPEDLERLETCYLDAYRDEAAGDRWWPADRMMADASLAVFKLDKAIYELSYELDNRPDWIDVPLAAIEETMDGRSSTPGTWTAS